MRKAGFSLLEVVISSAIVVIILGGLIDAYVSTRRFDLVNRRTSAAWSILIRELESIKRMHYKDLLNLAKSPTHGYWYVFRSEGDDGEDLYGVDAIDSISMSVGEFLALDPYRDRHFDPMGLPMGSVRVYIDRVKMDGTETDHALNIKVVVSWKAGKHVFGGDKNLNGIEDPDVDVLDAQGRFVSYVSAETSTCSVFH